MKVNAQYSSLVSRMRSVKGHLSSVADMVENREEPEKILHQLNAVQCALHKMRCEILLQRVSASLNVILSDKCPEKTASEINRLLHLYRTHT